MALQGFLCASDCSCRFPSPSTKFESEFAAEIGNQIQFGSLLKLTGPAQYLVVRKIYWRLTTHMQLCVWSCRLQWRVSWWQRRKWISTINPLPNSPSLRSSWWLKTLPCGRGGGLALWVKGLEHFQVHLRQNTNFILFKLQALRLLARHRFERVNGFDATMTQQNCPNNSPVVLPSVWMLPLQSLDHRPSRYYYC